jgi:hypothetical protein
VNYVGRKYSRDKMLVARYFKSQILPLLALTMHFGNMEPRVQKANYEFWYYDSKSAEVDMFLNQDNITSTLSLIRLLSPNNTNF